LHHRCPCEANSLGVFSINQSAYQYHRSKLTIL
jgi:hypothetical protein